MERKFFCTSCKAQLNVGTDIIFTVKTNKKNAGLLLVSPQVGNYNVKKDSLFEINKGDKLEIICPVCHHNFHDDSKDSKLAKVHMKNENGEISEIYFSEVFGEKCTYMITNNSVEYFGEDAEKYNFWGQEFNY